MFTEAGALGFGTRAPVFELPTAAGIPRVSPPVLGLGPISRTGAAALYPHRAAPALRLRAKQFAGGENPIPPDARFPAAGQAALARRSPPGLSHDGLKDAAFLTWNSGREPYFFASRVRPTYRKSTSLTPDAAATAAKALLA